MPSKATSTKQAAGLQSISEEPDSPDLSTDMSQWIESQLASVDIANTRLQSTISDMHSFLKAHRAEQSSSNKRLQKDRVEPTPALEEEQELTVHDRIYNMKISAACAERMASCGMTKDQIKASLDHLDATAGGVTIEKLLPRLVEATVDDWPNASKKERELLSICQLLSVMVNHRLKLNSTTVPYNILVQMGEYWTPLLRDMMRVAVHESVPPA